MKLFIKTAILALLCGAFVSCGDDEDYDPIKQQEEFKAFLDGKEIRYDTELAKEYIYKVPAPDSIYLFDPRIPTGPQVNSGDEISIYYIAWAFNKSGPDGLGRRGVYATNIRGVAEAMGLDIPEGTTAYDPVSFTLGDKDVLKGFNRAIPGTRVGDAVLLYLSADFIHGGKNQVGYLPPDEPVIFEVYIYEKISE